MLLQGEIEVGLTEIEFLDENNVGGVTGQVDQLVRHQGIARFFKYNFFSLLVNNGFVVEEQEGAMRSLFHIEDEVVV